MNTLVKLVGQYLIFLVALIAVFFTLRSQKTVRNQIITLAVVAFPLAVLMGWVAGQLYFHTRPFVVEGVQPLIPHEPNNGFPSDHTLLAMTTSAVMLVHRRKVGLLLLLLTVLIGTARVMAKIHYPVDILGGAAIGLVATGVAWATQRWWQRRSA